MKVNIQIEPSTYEIALLLLRSRDVCTEIDFDAAGFDGAAGTVCTVAAAEFEADAGVRTGSAEVDEDCGSVGSKLCASCQPLWRAAGLGVCAGVPCASASAATKRIFVFIARNLRLARLAGEQKL